MYGQSQLVLLMNDAFSAEVADSTPKEDVETLTRDYVSAVEVHSSIICIYICPSMVYLSVHLLYIDLSSYCVSIWCLPDCIAAQAVREMVSSMLVGGTERLHYRPFQVPYRGTSLIRNRNPLGPYRKPMPGVLAGWAFSYGRGTPVYPEPCTLRPVSTPSTLNFES